MTNTYVAPSGYILVKAWVDWLGETVVETSRAREKGRYITFVSTKNGPIGPVAFYDTLEDAEKGHDLEVKSHGGDPEGFYPRPDWYIKRVCG